tara:strand:+ start:321 stop:560 length:240 start_codon:yes stop_codon:yes gene_type:complete
MPKCEIKWVDERGAITPDTNQAIGTASVQFYAKDGKESHKREFPICSAHLERMPAGMQYRGFPNNHLKFSEWTFEPFEG